MNDPPNKKERYEDWWKWVMRGTAIVIIAYLMLTSGLSVPIGLYVLLMGMLFGPDFIKAQNFFDKGPK